MKLTDIAPLAIAYEKGFFEDEGLYVQLEAQANWEVLTEVWERTHVADEAILLADRIVMMTPGPNAKWE